MINWLLVIIHYFPFIIDYRYLIKIATDQYL